MNIESSFLKGIISKVISKILGKKLGKKIALDLEDVRIEFCGEKASIGLSVYAEMDKNDFKTLIFDKIGI